MLFLKSEVQFSNNHRERGRRLALRNAEFSPHRVIPILSTRACGCWAAGSSAGAELWCTCLSRIVPQSMLGLLLLLIILLDALVLLSEHQIEAIGCATCRAHFLGDIKISNSCILLHCGYFTSSPETLKHGFDNSSTLLCIQVCDIFHQTSYSKCQSPSTTRINTQVGVKILFDTSWQHMNIPESEHVTGIGLHLQFQIAQASCRVISQSYGEHVTSVGGRNSQELFFHSKRGTDVWLELIY